MTEEPTVMEVEPCPLCGESDLELFEEMPMPDGQKIMASVYAQCCGIQVNGATLRDAVEKWNRLCNCDDEVEDEQQC